MFSYLNSAFGMNLRRGPTGLPTRAACAAQPASAVAQRFVSAHPSSKDESDPLNVSVPIAPDLT
jgi:hypothetical protein